MADEPREPEEPTEPEIPSPMASPAPPTSDTGTGATDAPAVSEEGGAEPPTAEGEEGGEEGPPRSKKKLILAAVAALVVIGILGTGAMLFMASEEPDEESTVAEEPATDDAETIAEAEGLTADDLLMEMETTADMTEETALAPEESEGMEDVSVQIDELVLSEADEKLAIGAATDNAGTSQVVTEEDVTEEKAAADEPAPGGTPATTVATVEKSGKVAEQVPYFVVERKPAPETPRFVKTKKVCCGDELKSVKVHDFRRGVYHPVVHDFRNVSELCLHAG